MITVQCVLVEQMIAPLAFSVFALAGGEQKMIVWMWQHGSNFC
jgi:hypothetical protein